MSLLNGYPMLCSGWVRRPLLYPPHPHPPRTLFWHGVPKCLWLCPIPLGPTALLRLGCPKTQPPALVAMRTRQASTLEFLPNQKEAAGAGGDQSCPPCSIACLPPSGTFSTIADPQSGYRSPESRPQAPRSLWIWRLGPRSRPCPCSQGTQPAAQGKGEVGLLPRLRGRCPHRGAESRGGATHERTLPDGRQLPLRIRPGLQDATTLVP